MFCSVLSAAISGVEAFSVCVEADVSDGMPVFSIVGSVSHQVREGQDRVRTALRNLGVSLPPKRITVNLAPGDMHKEGSRFDLPIAVDVEDNKLKPLSAAALSELVAYAADTIESWGLYAMVYTYTYYSNTELDMDALAAYDLWIADYRGKRPTRKHGMWQYTSKGSLPGISGNVDKNHVYKDYPGIIRRAGLTCLRG